MKKNTFRRLIRQIAQADSHGKLEMKISGMYVSLASEWNYLQNRRALIHLIFKAWNKWKQLLFDVSLEDTSSSGFCFPEA